jgi:hypothetical protein
MILSIFTGAFGLAVLITGLCRLRFINAHTHKLLWVGAYLFNALGGLLALFEATQLRVHPSTLVLLIGISLALWGSRKSWRDGAPHFMERS